MHNVELKTQFPIVTLVGLKGTGKTVTMTAIGLEYHFRDNQNIFSNYELYNVDYTPITFELLAAMPEWLRDGVVLIDESHIGADAYKFFKKEVQDMSKFLTQTRKRHLTIFMTTQVYKQNAVRFRLLTDYIIECEKTNLKGFHHLAVYERVSGEIVNELVLDARPYFEYYDTDQIIK